MFDQIGRARFVVLKDHTKVLESSGYMGMDSQVLAEMTFSEGCAAVRQLRVEDTLRGIAKQVGEIVDGFGPEFA